jgi:glucose/arabinose dehydrogenase/cytochrome c553
MSHRLSVGTLRAVLVAGVAIAAHAATANAQDPFSGPYVENCSVCHGENLEGAAQGTPLVGELKHGASIDEISASIAAGFPDTGMPAWSDALDELAIQRIAIYISERRSSLVYSDFKVDTPLSFPEGVIASELHGFRLETVAEGLDPLTYSIAPLPDGRILVTEKTRGMRIVSPNGELSEPIEGAPQPFDDGFKVPGILLVYGTGYLLDVALHPDYADNGWIYLSYTERCTDCNAASRGTPTPVSMTKLIRGRIEDGAWVDEQVIWSTDVENYTALPDMVAGGRIAFDGDGNVFLSIGAKGAASVVGVQDLSLPYGKILRLHDDGSIPSDNPFVDDPDALAAIWSYGHRSPQGLEFDPVTGRLWGTEMGPRGGDEVNLLLPGRNYGWPLYSLGIDYSGAPIEYGRELGVELDLDAIEQPVVDLTPSPAVSSFIVYDGDAFPQWRSDLIVGTLKATELYRMVVDGDEVVHREVLLSDFGRIRDIESAPDGAILLLVEHESGSQIVRLVPDPAAH